MQITSATKDNPTDTLMIVDAYLRTSTARAARTDVDAVHEADDLRRFVLATARHPRLVAITEAHDAMAQQAYADAGFDVIALNGDRAQGVQGIVERTAQVIDKDYPRRLILVTVDSAFALLARQALQQNTEVLVWGWGRLPAELACAEFIVRDLERDVFHPTRHPSTVAIYMDYANIHIDLERRNVLPSPQRIVHAVRSITADLGKVTHFHAYADWKQLSRSCKIDVQRKLTAEGVTTHYVIDRNGKNSADMLIAKDVNKMLAITASKIETVDAFVLISGDSDFVPTVQSVQQAGRTICVLTVKRALSKRLQRVADDIRYLDPYFMRGIPLNASFRCN